ncbi:hypothetical protein A4R43_18680 [Amycolatopsis albispora]|uniref:Uncharacterized protein n=1 Tax=Amycolatopsis albispora TaxID=1804986 RepID=A0A344L8C2_9PSEU|nr:hypothetical protein A4R43_18680 [Amycolatopsis albispora]
MKATFIAQVYDTARSYEGVLLPVPGSLESGGGLLGSLVGGSDDVGGFEVGGIGGGVVVVTGGCGGSTGPGWVPGGVGAGGGVTTVVVGTPSGPVVTMVVGAALLGEVPGTGTPLTSTGSCPGCGLPGTSAPGPPPGPACSAGGASSAELGLENCATAPNAVASASPLAARMTYPVRCRRPPGSRGGATTAGWLGEDPGDWGIGSPCGAGWLDPSEHSGAGSGGDRITVG